MAETGSDGQTGTTTNPAGTTPSAPRHIPWHVVALVLLAGVLGGVFGWVVAIAIPDESTQEIVKMGAVLAMVLGGGAAFIGVFVLANTDTRQRVRLAAIAFVFGMTPKPIFEASRAFVDRAIETGERQEVEAAADQLEALVDEAESAVAVGDAFSESRLRAIETAARELVDQADRVKLSSARSTATQGVELTLERLGTIYGPEQQGVDASTRAEVAGAIGRVSQHAAARSAPGVSDAGAAQLVSFATEDASADVRALSAQQLEDLEGTNRSLGRPVVFEVPSEDAPGLGRGRGVTPQDPASTVNLAAIIDQQDAILTRLGELQTGMQGLNEPRFTTPAIDLSSIRDDQARIMQQLEAINARVTNLNAVPSSGTGGGTGAEVSLDAVTKRQLDAVLRDYRRLLESTRDTRGTPTAATTNTMITRLRDENWVDQQLTRISGIEETIDR